MGHLWPMWVLREIGKRRRLTLVLGLVSVTGMVWWRPEAAAVAVPTVEVRRVPDGGYQPRVAIDERGVVHMVYLRGAAARSDAFYVSSGDGGRSFSTAIHVNSVPET